MSERRPTTPVPTVTAEPATPRRPRIWPRRVPARIGRARTSTVVLAVLFVGSFSVWDPSAMSRSLSDPAPASTEQPAPTSDAPAPTTTPEPTATTSEPTPPSTSAGPTTTSPSATDGDGGSPTGTREPTTGTPGPTTTAPRTTEAPPTS